MSALVDGLSLKFESSQVSRTLLSILADLNSVVVWIVSTRHLISKTSSSYNNPSVTIRRDPIAIGISFTFIFHGVFNSLARSKYLSFSFSFSFILWSAGTAKFTIFQVLFFLLMIIKSGLLADIRWSVCMTKSSRSLCLILLDRGMVVLIQFFHEVKFKFLAQFPVDHPILSSLILFLFLFCCICFLCDWSFRLYYHITYVCYFVASYLLLW